ncbi:MAG: packaging ATPase [Edafosvirus sp.]|uniref:Packaging ATPase n=1 Tax=Edafosvirus sp. TaxID=2487765 RepID=A0A3G4ZTM9_9VIRU|nr:MAG: packaging ATPase [Edafosvirus sp.]
MAIKDINVNGGDTLPIQDFKLESMCRNPSIVMIAKRGCGKSWVCRAILKHFYDFPVGVIIAPTDKMSCFYGNFFPDLFIHYKYESKIIERLLYRQEMMIDKKKEKKKIKRKVDPRAFIVMDDCLSKKGTWMKDQPILELLFNGRHYELMYILTMQYPLGISPELRGNFDYIFLLAEDFHSNLKRIYDHYAGMFPTFDSFRQVFAQLTEDFGCMVVVNRGARKNFLEKVFWYKAPDIEIANMGCQQFRDYHDRNYDKEWRKKQKKMDLTEYCLKKKKDRGTLKVNKVDGYQNDN